MTLERIPLLDHPLDEPAVFRPENLLQRAATMMGKQRGDLPACCILALSQVRGAEIVSLLHVTNTFAETQNDFCKGPADVNERILNCCFETFLDACQ